MNENNVSCRNINVIVKYVSQNSGDINYLLSNLPYSPKFLVDEKNWIPLNIYNEIMNRAITILKDKNAPYKIGMSALLLESWGLFRYVQKVFLAITIDPLLVYKKVSEYNPLFNNTKKISLVSHEKNKCLLKVKFNEGINPLDDYHSDAYIRGMLASIPQNWNLSPAKVIVITSEYDLLSLINNFGNFPKEKIIFKDDLLIVNDEIIGKKIYTNNYDIWMDVILKNHDKEHIIINENLFFNNLFNENSKEVGILITKNFSVNKNLTLSMGEIYNANHFLYNISWEKPSLFKKIKHLFSYIFTSREIYEKNLSASLSAIKDYMEILEEKVDERTKQLNKAKHEAEYWRGKTDQLLSTMLPSHIMPEMVKGKIEAVEVYGSVMFIDIVNFTEYTKNNDDRNVNEYLQKYFSEISQIVKNQGGWVNKFMGDGALVIFGLNKNENTAHSAIKSAINILNILHNYPWQVRVGVSTGTFIAGEYGDGELRRFDCVGNTVNLSSRLQSAVNPNEIIVCKNTHKILKEINFNFNSPIKINAKGIGEIEGYTLLTKTKYEVLV